MKERENTVSRSNRLALILFITLVVIVGTLSLLPQTAPPGGGVDLGLHTLTYGALTVLAFKAFRWSWWLIALGIFLYSTALEGLQNFVPGRNGSLEDIASNGLGIACGLIIVLMGRALFRRKTAGARIS